MARSSGFPQMAHPMIEWALDTFHRDLFQPVGNRVDKAILLTGPAAYESALLDLMERIVRDYPSLHLFSLPSVVNRERRHLELGVEGEPPLVDKAMDTSEEVDPLSQIEQAEAALYNVAQGEGDTSGAVHFNVAVGAALGMVEKALNSGGGVYLAGGGFIDNDFVVRGLGWNESSGVLGALRVDGNAVAHGAAGEHRVRDFGEREHRAAERGAEGQLFIVVVHGSVSSVKSRFDVPCRSCLRLRSFDLVFL